MDICRHSGHNFWFRPRAKLRTDAKKNLITFFYFYSSIICLFWWQITHDNSSWWLELRLITNYYRNPSILQISFLFFAYQLLLILLTLIGGSCSLIPAFSVRKKTSERITDGKTLLTMCVKLSLCEIAAKSHLVFTRLSPCSALTSRSSRFPSCSARTSLAYPSSFCQAGTRTTKGDSWLCIFQRNKNELPVNTPSPNTHSTSNITASQRTRTIYFFFF